MIWNKPIARWADYSSGTKRLTVTVTLLLNRELEHRRAPERLPRLKYGAWKLRLVRRIRKVLRLQIESIAPLIDLTALPRDGSIQEVPRVKLNSRLRGGNLQHAPAVRIFSSRRRAQLILLFADH